MDEVEVSVSYVSGAYVTGFLIMLVGVVLPMVYMVLQNKKAFKAILQEGKCSGFEP
ncbi:hypothetical protein GN244_ATG13769 [Phytophthora infestans]|uniref:Uncharacterized protein n=1 Tax=Phytophthora infestans TaxID=4787 RepID=A0A833SKM3_PHYIN|nr:hypothetical protein GN244_ATG19385 [Phytophthora infestans]KAF4034269.1 hypothetical protein GN244_ATG13769 [Phytophthora infestans]